jgi:hypothetical protein
MSKLAAGAFSLALALLAVPSSGLPKIHEIVVASSRVRVGDIVPGLAAEAAKIDLGPSPSASATRIVERDEIVQALQEHGVEAPPGIAPAVRVLRKMKRLDAVELEHIVRDSLGPGLPRGVTLTGVHALRTVEVPDGWTRVTAEVPRPARRTGVVGSQASVMFYEDSQALWMLSVPVDLTVSPDGALADVQHGARISLVLRRGLVEVTTSGTAGTDANVGGIVQIVLHPSGRIVLGRLEDKDHAVAMDIE